MKNMEEAWLTGKIEGVPEILMPAAHALVQAARDIEEWVLPLSMEELWFKPNGAQSVGFHLLHIAGSIDRLETYARGGKLSERQFAGLAAEQTIDESATPESLVKNTTERIAAFIESLKKNQRETLFEVRTVGRKELPTNVFGLLFHIAEHTQRHVGQIIATRLGVPR